MQYPKQTDNYDVDIFNSNFRELANKDTEIDKKISENTNAITTEVNRAKAAEKSNSDAIAAEASRAKVAEKANADAIAEEISRATEAEELKAPIASPIFTGTPKAPTASANTNNTQIATTAFANTAVANHNSSSTAHDDIRTLISVLTDRFNALADSDDTTLDQLSEIVAYIKNNKSLIDSITTSKVNVSDIVDNLNSTATNKPLSAKQGKVLKDLIDSLTSVVDDKVDKVSGKGLSTNDYTTNEKNKLAGIASGATKNSASTTTPKANGTANAGTESAFARGDHIHPLQTSVSGNSGTATKLATARNFNGMSVDGSADRFNYGTCPTVAGTAAKVVDCTGFVLATGAEITVKFTVTNTAANPTLNVNSTGAKAIYYRGAAITAGYLAANRTYTFRYNGTQWDLVGDIDINTNTTYSDMKGATADTAGTHGLVPAPAAGAQGKFLRADGTWQTPTNTNNAVTQTNTSGADADYRVLMSYTADDTTRTEGARKATGLAYNIKNAILKVAKRLQVGNRAFLFEDSEGGNLQLVAPDDTVWEIDAVDGNLRIFTYANNVRYGIIINKLGQVIVPYGAWGTFNGEMYGAFAARGGEGGRGIHANANEFGIDLPPEEGYAGGLTWYQGTTPVGCIGYYKQGEYHYIGTDYANPTGSLKLGTLVGVNVYGGNLIHMWTDNEGGNLGLAAPDGTNWEMDAYNGDFRIFNYEDGNPGVAIGKSGKFYARKGLQTGEQSDALTVQENIITAPNDIYLIGRSPLLSKFYFCYSSAEYKGIEISTSSSGGQINFYKKDKITYLAPTNQTANYIWVYLPSSGGTLATTSSDIRLKDNIEDTDVNDALSIVNKIQFRQFTWKDSGRQQKIGVVADELETIDADMVMQGTGGYTEPDENGKREINPKCVDTFYLMGYYGKAIQELSAIIQNQQKTIDGLKKENSNLSERLERVEKASGISGNI